MRAKAFFCQAEQEQLDSQSTDGLMTWKAIGNCEG